MTLRDRILAILDDHDDYERCSAKGLSPWCGCYEGDLSGAYSDAREEAADALVALFAEVTVTA
jgi:hypothetical protein